MQQNLATTTVIDPVLIESRFKPISERIKNICVATKIIYSFNSIYSAIILRTIFFILAILAFTGFINFLMDAVGYNRVFASVYSLMNDSLQSSVAHTIVLTVIKSALSLFQSSIIGFMGTSLSVGQVVSGLSELNDFLFRFFLVSSGLIAAQIALLNLIELIGIALLVGIGLLCLAIQPSKDKLFGRMGRLLVVIGLVLYLLFPATISIVGHAYKTQRTNAEIQNKENIAVVSQRASEITLKSMTTKEGREVVHATFSDGIRSIWGGFMSLLISYILIFLLLPVVSLGLCYIVVRQTMDGIGLGNRAMKIDNGSIDLINWIHKGKYQDMLEKRTQLSPTSTPQNNNREVQNEI